MAHPTDVSISIPNNPHHTETITIEQKLNKDFCFFTLMNWTSLFLAPIGSIMTMKFCPPDSFGLVLLIMFELFLVCGSILSIVAKKKIHLQIYEYAMQFWHYNALVTIIFIIYVLMVLGDLNITYTWHLKNLPITNTIYSGHSLKIMTLAFYLPVHVGLALYLLIKSRSIKSLLVDKERLQFLFLTKNKEDLSMTQTQIDISKITHNL